MPRFHLHPTHSSLVLTTVLSVPHLPLGWILSQTQSGAPLRAKSKDMIARECLVFYKIGYSSWETFWQREREKDLNFCSRPKSTVAPDWCNRRARVRNYTRNNLLKISCLFTQRRHTNISDADRGSISIIRINIYQQRDEVRKYSLVQT